MVKQTTRDRMIEKPAYQRVWLSEYPLRKLASLQGVTHWCFTSFENKEELTIRSVWKTRSSLSV